MQPETNKVVRELCAMHPEFLEALDDPYSEGLILVFCDFARILVRLSQARQPPDFGPLFAYLEVQMVNGTEQVKNAVATCFLEALLNAADEAPELLRPLMRLLGPECRDYCTQLNAMHGITRIPW